MTKRVHMLNTKTRQVIEIDQNINFLGFLRAARFWFVAAFGLGRPMMGLVGVALIAAVLVFGAVLDNGKPVATAAALAYIALGFYFAINRRNMLVRQYLKRGWVRADDNSAGEARHSTKITL